MTEKPVVVEIRCNATGEVRTLCASLPVEDGLLDPYYWSDGNNACDCCRDGLFHGRQGDVPCTSDAYSVRITDAASGAEVYRDGEWA